MHRRGQWQGQRCPLRFVSRQRPVVREFDVVGDAVVGRIETAQPEPVEFEFEEEGLPGGFIVGEGRGELRVGEEAAGGAHVLVFDGVEISEHDGAPVFRLTRVERVKHGAPLLGLAGDGEARLGVDGVDAQASCPVEMHGRAERDAAATAGAFVRQDDPLHVRERVDAQERDARFVFRRVVAGRARRRSPRVMHAERVGDEFGGVDVAAALAVAVGFLQADHERAADHGVGAQRFDERAQIFAAAPAHVVTDEFDLRRERGGRRGFAQLVRAPDFQQARIVARRRRR
jgi:hypothetical protein